MSGLASFPTLANAVALDPLLRRELWQFSDQIARPIWQKVPYAPENFSVPPGSLMTFTPRGPASIQRNSILQIGKNAWLWDVRMSLFSIGGTPGTVIRLRLPLGLQAIETSAAVWWGRDNVVPTTFLAFVGAASEWLNLARTDVAAFTATNQGTLFVGSIAFESLNRPT